ncbi:DEAD/DEAH box helicase [archaeon]|nr:DEAD/DEAH box helicase [archaeon]
MARRKNEDSATRLVNLGLNKNQLALFFDAISEQNWDKAIKLYEKLEIIRESLNEKDKLYILLRDNIDTGKGFDVNLEIIDKKLVSFCSCQNREDKGCEHAGCALIYKLLKEKNNDFNKVLATDKKFSKEIKLSDLDYFKNLLPKVDEEVEKQYMIYFNFSDFDFDRQILSIERGLIKKDGTYGAPVKFHGKNFDTDKWDISKNVRKVLNFINGDNYGMRYSTGGFQKSRFYDVNTDLMMPVLKDIYFEEPEIIFGATFAKDKFEIIWEIKKNKDKYILEPFFVSGNKKVSLLNLKLLDLGNTTLWAYENENKCFYEYKNQENLTIVRGILRFPKKLELSEEELREFFSNYYKEVLNDFEFKLSNTLKRDTKSVIPTAKIYLEKSGQTAKIKLKFDYAGQKIDYFSANKEIILVEDNHIFDVSRDLEYEDEIIEKLNEHDVVTDESKDEFVLDCDLVDFVSEEIPKITDLGIEIFGEDKLFNFKVVKTSPKMIMNVGENKDWFELKGSVKFGKEEVDLKKVLESVFKNKRFVELSDGKKAVIPKNWVNNLRGYSGFFDLSNEEAKLSKQHLAILDSILNLSEKINMDSKVKDVLNKFRTFDKIKSYSLPKKLNAELREYQKAGFDWMNFLREFNFNGILADDMGLGKTIQTLILLQKMKEENKKLTSLVIVPTSLVFNWKSEAEKFTPDLKISIHHGIKRDKKNFDKLLKENNLIITTYGVLKNDLDLFLEKEFDYIILDEAHTIKNPVSVSAKSVFMLKGKNKLALSGTPIQNNLTELWSLFNFLNPGYLGTHDFFREHFLVGIENNKDTTITASLRRLINPFILRRTKKIIADELPEKTEMVLRSSFSKEEKELYDNWKEYYKKEIKDAVNEKGMGGAKLKILEGLMKLRQISLHPKLIDTEYKGSSSKFDLLMMEVEKILEEGHKVLIFSSFVKMLTIVKEEFERRDLRYSYLDGKTKDRENVVSRFQNSVDAEAFLISIKAGGVGLNLTSADYVFIIDPWWNPAVEMQAMDRAHRIGQENKVFVYKMIVEETIEEKILKLQESKKKLVDDLITEEEGFMKEINIKDIEELFS